ncbi:hypothetical protein CARUB_v10007272mg [Capsella rubella]|uniref:F-box domain-containing protein n=1 Tax=Capsella rubella TaxID=81985 RepID=R0FAE7_9BRAS|nr:hypothetical protein CARUB_v10007272mg [Capsella rubella]
MAMYDLPKDLLEEILSRVPVESIRALQYTCKTWNTILVVMMTYYKVCLMSLNLHGVHKNDKTNVKSCVVDKAKLISLNDDEDHRVDHISNVFHCDGLLLCITRNLNSRLVVCNPYCGQTRWINYGKAYHFFDRYALGYEKMNNNSIGNHKVLRCCKTSFCGTYKFDIYNFKSDSWKVFHLELDWEIPFLQRGVSLKGNTYWFAREKNIEGLLDPLDFLICFDFTTERFGPRLHLPFHSCCNDTVALSSVREEQLAVLFQRKDTLRMEIWVTNKIDPEEALWNKLLLEVSMGLYSQFNLKTKSFIIDEKQNVVVLLGRHDQAYIIGKDGYFKEIDLGIPRSSKYASYPLVLSYVPSSVQICKMYE